MTRTIDTGTTHLLAELHDDGVLVATLNRPDTRNAFSGAMVVRLVISIEWLILMMRCVLSYSRERHLRSVQGQISQMVPMFSNAQTGLRSVRIR